MNNQEILQKAMSKARENGYDKQMERRLVKENGIDITVEMAAIEPGEWGLVSVEKYSVPTRLMVLSHDFARAFWGIVPYLHSRCTCHPSMPMWKYHLQQMVLQEDPVKYLEQFLQNDCIRTS